MAQNTLENLNSYTKSLGLKFLKILETQLNYDDRMAGWQGVESFTCLGQNHELWDIDIRYAWGREIFHQNLVDHGWSEATLLYKKRLDEVKRHKLVIYFCEDSTELGVDQKFAIVPERFIIGRYWETVQHLYLSLSGNQHFKISESLKSVNNKLTGYATTQNLTSQKPHIDSPTDSKLKTLLFLPPHPKRQGEGGLRTQNLFKQKNTEKPLISIITVVFNGEKYIEQTIQSVINQSYDNVEYIIIDGGSTDETLNIIQRYENQIDYWISEPDQGIYDAMNKGTLAATGSHTWHINADDLIFKPNSLKLMLEKGSKNDSYLNFLGGIIILLVESKGFYINYPKLPDKNPYINIISSPVKHQGFIGIKNLTSGFDPSYTICADAITMAKKLSLEPFHLACDIIAIFRTGGSHENNYKGLKELSRAISDSKSINVYFKFYPLALYYFFRGIAKILGLVAIKRKHFNNTNSYFKNNL